MRQEERKHPAVNYNDYQLREFIIIAHMFLIEIFLCIEKGFDYLDGR